MRVFILLYFLTLVWLNQIHGAPDNTPFKNSPLWESQINTELKKTDPEADDEWGRNTKIATHHLLLGGLGGDILERNNNQIFPYLGYFKNKEYEFEKYYQFGGFYTFNKALSFFIAFPLTNNLSYGLIHFIDSSDALSNLVNINHAKLTLEYRLIPTLSLKFGYGLGGLYYALQTAIPIKF